MDKFFLFMVIRTSQINVQLVFFSLEFVLKRALKIELEAKRVIGCEKCLPWIGGNDGK